MSDKRFYAALKGAVFCDNKLLIVKRSMCTRGEYGLWELPGGRMEFGEQPEETLIREFSEEVGLEVEPIRPLNTWTFLRDENTQIVGITYLCSFKGGEVRLSSEHLDYAWVTLQDLANYKLIPSIAEQIEKWDL